MRNTPWRFRRLPASEASGNPFATDNPFPEQLAYLVIARQIKKGWKGEGFSQGIMCLPLQDGERLACGVRAIERHVGHRTIRRAKVDADAELPHVIEVER